MLILPAARPALALSVGLVAVLLMRSARPLVLVTALCALTALLACGAGPVTRLGVGVLTWALANGFVENRFGELSWHGRPDALLLTALSLTALAAAATPPAHATANPAPALKEL